MCTTYPTDIYTNTQRYKITSIVPAYGETTIPVPAMSKFAYPHHAHGIMCQKKVLRRNITLRPSRIMSKADGIKEC